MAFSRLRYRDDCHFSRREAKGNTFLLRYQKQKARVQYGALREATFVRRLFERSIRCSFPGFRVIAPLTAAHEALAVCTLPDHISVSVVIGFDVSSRRPNATLAARGKKCGQYAVSPMSHQTE